MDRLEHELKKEQTFDENGLLAIDWDLFDGQKLLVLGPRRSGKTSFLKYLSFRWSNRFHDIFVLTEDKQDWEEWIVEDHHILPPTLDQFIRWVSNKLKIRQRRRRRTEEPKRILFLVELEGYEPLDIVDILIECTHFNSARFSCTFCFCLQTPFLPSFVHVLGRLDLLVLLPSTTVPTQLEVHSYMCAGLVSYQEFAFLSCYYHAIVFSYTERKVYYTSTFAELPIPFLSPSPYQDRIEKSQIPFLQSTLQVSPGCAFYICSILYMIPPMISNLIEEYIPYYYCDRCGIPQAKLKRYSIYTNSYCNLCYPLLPAYLIKKIDRRRVIYHLYVYDLWGYGLVSTDIWSMIWSYVACFFCYFCGNPQEEFTEAEIVKKKILNYFCRSCCGVYPEIRRWMFMREPFVSVQSM
jgi:hypothetical protein